MAFVRIHAGHIVGLDGRDLRACGLCRRPRGPRLPIAEALAAEPRLAAERLLRDEAVGAGAAGVDLIIDEVVELEWKCGADRDRLSNGSPVRPSYRTSSALDRGLPASQVADVLPRSRRRRWRATSAEERERRAEMDLRTCPMFIRDGTPRGFWERYRAACRRAGRGISSSRRMRETTPLLPWRPAILSPLKFGAARCKRGRSAFTPGPISSRSGGRTLYGVPRCRTRRAA